MKSKRKSLSILSIFIVIMFSFSLLGYPFDDEDDDVRAKRLTGQIDYSFVGHLGLTDDEGRTLIWEGTIEGDLNGTMKWWFGPAPAPTIPYQGGRVNYYVARWEIWDSDGEKLLLAGDSAGKTVTRVDADSELWDDGMWDGHGVVTKASRGFNRLKGRSIYETGTVIWDFPYSGTGIFVIY